MSAKLNKAATDLQEEKELNRSLLANQSTWQQRVTGLETQLQKLREEKDSSIKDLQEQLQDIMLYMDMQAKCKDTELEGGQVVVGASPTTSRASHGSSGKGPKSRKHGK